MKFYNTFLITLLTTIQLETVNAKCDAQNIIDRCVQDQSVMVKSCAPTDSQCLCSANTALIACYQSCPNDEKVAGQAQVQQSQATIYCNAANQEKALSSASSSSTSASSSSASSAISSASPSSVPSSKSQVGKKNTTTEITSSDSVLGAFQVASFPNMVLFSAVLLSAGFYN